ncbi:expressed unknown protein [Seminavis robusta]|uniref:Uncharacterized protein n=1 Tax=Seminavis robusta TaxID=568900 RepID=A0A9N8E0G1_9STRA|nr:expressed unknown protein [Seminavis robusta]|eukprot:Sro426_g140540.1 n/a (329) ;mRNA; f:62763-63749
MASAVVGEEPPAKRQRVDDVPAIEGKASARRKLAEAGFDPDDCVTAQDSIDGMTPAAHPASCHSVTPMSYFCDIGDLPMCRYILLHGGVTKRTLGEFWFPLYTSICRRHLDIARWLFQNGAWVDVHTKNLNGRSPFALCWDEFDDNQVEMGKWFLVNGALKDLEASSLAGLLRDRVGGVDFRPQLLCWSQVEQIKHDSFQAFLMGTFVVPEFSAHALSTKLVAKLGSEEAADIVVESLGKPKGERLWTKLTAHHKESPVQKISGNFGALKCIAEFVGGVLGVNKKQIERHRRLTEMLSISLREVVPSYDSDDSDEGYGDDDGDDDGDY